MLGSLLMKDYMTKIDNGDTDAMHSLGYLYYEQKNVYRNVKILPNGDK